MAKKTLPVAPVNMPMEATAPKADKKYAERERRYAAEEGLRTLNRAAEIKRDKVLLKDIKTLAKEQMKAVSK